MKITSLLFCSTASLLAFPQNAKPETGNGNKPNVVIFIADDAGWDDFGCYGNCIVKTPNIDRLANQGIRFDNFLLTTSSCSPSRASILAGRYPHNTGAAELHTFMDDQMPVFPGLLKEAGYYTVSAGKWHLGDAVKNAFDHVYDNGKEIGDGGENMWVPVVKERPKDKPFFFWFASLDPHRPWGPNEFSGTHNPDDIVVPHYLADTYTTREDIAKYYDEITRFDHFVGLTIEELEKQGVLDNTLIIVMSDNGSPFPRCKTRVYDSGMKSPFVIKWNKVTGSRGSVCKSLISAIDIAPTLLEIAGLKPISSFQGKSFKNVIKNPALPFRNYLFAEHNWHDYEACERMVRTSDFMYVINFRPNLSNNGPADSNRSPSFQDLLNLKNEGRLTAAQAELFSTPRPHEELFNLKSDPLQLVNVASLPQYADILDELREVMNRWREETIDTVPETLTPDWFDRETGEMFTTGRNRGDMPGGNEAVKTTAKGPF